MRRFGWSLPILFLGSLHWAACSGEEDLGKVRGELVTEELFDFGDVQVGILQAMEVPVSNKGNGTLTITNIEVGETFSGVDYEFKLGTNKVALAPNQTRDLGLTFQPFASMEQPVESTFRIVTDTKDDTGNIVTFTVTVRGRGITSGLEVMPDPVDFGKVLVGSSRSLDVKIFNRLSVGVDITSAMTQDGKPLLINQGGLGRFELIDPLPDPARGGSLLPSGSLLAADDSLTVTLRYVPDPSQEDREDLGRWTISNCANPLCDKDVNLKGSGTNAAIECDPPNIDFGQVNPGATLTLSTICSNVATESITVLGWELASGTAPEYSVVPYTGQVANLGPGETFQVETQFSPSVASVGTDPAGAINIRGRNPAANRDLSPARVELTGEAGGPDISVIPPSLNFGQVAIGTSSKKRILIENTGFNQLTVSEINADTQGTAVFTADRTAFTVDPGLGEVVEITFTPLAQEQYLSEILVVSDDADEGELRIEVQGQGISLPPCAYRLTPSEINFGIVQVLRTTSQGVRIENIGSNDCLVNDVEIAPGSSGAFGLANGAETGVIIPAGTDKTIIVEYTPGAAGVDEGDLTFYISDPRNSTPEVPLRGVGSESALLFAPTELDFGTIGVGCSTRDRTVTVYNTGSATTRIDRIELPSGVTSEFELDNLPAGIPAPPGAQVAPGQSLEFTVRYRAADISQDIGFLHVFEAGLTDPYVLPLFGEGSADPTNEDQFQQLETPEVDIMFIIDNSCSMSEEQASLTANFQSFIQFADSQALDYRIGVVSTDVDGCSSPPGAHRPVGLDQGQCGYFADGAGGGGPQDPAWRLITPDEQPSPETAFTHIGTQGTNGSATERGLEAAYMALSSPIITGWNQGFLRPNAYLALVFISDEEDQSSNSVDFYINYFLAIKGFRNSNLFSASAIVGDEPSGCGGYQADPGTRYIATADRTGGIFESICTADWAQALQNLGLSVFGYKSRFFLGNQPVSGTVEVFVDGVKVEPTAPSGQVRWSYDPATNSINFAPLTIPEPGSEIVIRYQAECL